MFDLKESAGTIIKLDLLALGAIHESNRYISSIALTSNMLKPGIGKYYRWRHGDVFYHKTGKGKPLVLLHHLDPAFSSYEWNEIEEQLGQEHTVYSIDLPGCGRSIKDNTTYTNYHYIMFLSCFIKDVVKRKCTVMASGYSSSFSIMTASMNPSLIEKVIAVNPLSLKELSQLPDSRSKTAAGILSIPIIGTSVYNISQSKDNIDLAFTESYLFNPFRSKKRFVAAFYEGAHYNDSNGRYLLSSIKGKYLTVDIKRALSKAGDRIVILYGDKQDKVRRIISEYRNINSSIKILPVSNTKFLPHMERPEAFLEAYRSVM